MCVWFVFSECHAVHARHVAPEETAADFTLQVVASPWPVSVSLCVPAGTAPVHWK